MAPTYNYVCEGAKCQEAYEEILPVSEYQKQTKCPKCGSKGKKVIEAKNMKTGATHTPQEFMHDQRMEETAKAQRGMMHK